MRYFEAFVQGRTHGDLAFSVVVETASFIEARAAVRRTFSFQDFNILSLKLLSARAGKTADLAAKLVSGS